VRFLLSGLLLAILSSSATRPIYPQNAQAGDSQPKDQFFSGTVTAIDSSSLTVVRTVLGKNSSTKTFQVTAETRFEGGQPRVRSEVTVRYVTTDDGDRATHVILRRSPK
jgi:hypothetical protein